MWCCSTQKRIEAENIFIKGFFLPVYIRCLNEHLLQTEIHRFVLKIAQNIKCNLPFLLCYNAGYFSTTSFSKRVV
jgi:hypothetical protein